MKFDLIKLFRPKMVGEPSTLANPSADLIQALIGFPTAAGKPVTRATAVRVASFLSAVRVLCNDIAKMPLILRETTVVKGRQRTLPAINEPLYPILKDCPNGWQTSYQLRWFLASQLIMAGNCYCQIIRNGSGDVLSLNPLNAWNMTQRWDRTDPKNPKLYFQYADSTGNQKRFDYLGPDGLPSLWHTTSINLEGSGLEGSAIIALAKEALSVIMAAEETAGRNFANGLGMGGFISFAPEAEITEKQAQGVVDDLKKNFSGSHNAGKFTALPGGGKWEKMTFNAQESQLIESRKWNAEEVVRLLGGAPLLVKLGMGEKNSTYASSAAFLEEYYNTCLDPFCTSLEQTITRDLIAKEDRNRLCAEHRADSFTAGSAKERAETYEIQIRSFQLTPNQVNELEHRDTVEGGDVLFFPANSGYYDPATGEYAIPGQKAPEGAPAPVPGQTSTKVKAVSERLTAIANSLAERVMRKEAKGGIDVKFLTEVLSISQEQAETFIEHRKTMTDDAARAALVTLATGETDAL